MDPAGRGWRRLVALSVVVVVAILTVTAGAGADPTTTTPTITANTLSATTAPTTTAPLPDYSGLHADQVALVTAALQTTVEDDQGALAAAQAGLATAESTAATDAAALSAAQADFRTRQAASVAADQAAAAATAARVQANLTWLQERQQLARVAVELYAGGGASAASSTADPLQAAQQAAVGGVIISAGVQVLGARIDKDHAIWLADIRKEAVAVKAKTVAAAAASGASASLATAQAAATASQNGIPGAQSAVNEATAALSAVQASVSAKIAALSGPAPTNPIVPGDTSPTILGPSVISAADLTAWFNSTGYVDATSTPIDALVNLYLNYGTAEGVRGDIAFAQAMVETGGFDSPDATDLNNYAGIGHCDSCATGIGFASPALGVLGQIQLLRTYATPGLTTSELADPLALAALAPESQGIRGCCETWQSLTLHWATDPIYGETILNMYQQMLTFALRRAGVAVPAPAG